MSLILPLSPINTLGRSLAIVRLNTIGLPAILGSIYFITLSISWKNEYSVFTTSTLFSSILEMSNRPLTSSRMFLEAETMYCEFFTCSISIIM